MAVYLLIEVDILDPPTYAEYVRQVPDTVARYGGRYLVRHGDIVPLAGDWRPERVILLEFDSMERMTAWNFSPEYLALMPLRVRAARTRAIALHGCAPDGHTGA